MASKDEPTAAKLRAAYQAGWNAAVLHLQRQNMRVVQDFSTEQMQIGAQLAQSVFPDERKKDKE